MKETRPGLKSLNVKAAIVHCHVILKKKQGCGPLFLIPMLKDNEKLSEYRKHLSYKKSLKYSAYALECMNVYCNTQNIINDLK